MQSQCEVAGVSAASLDAEIGHRPDAATSATSIDNRGAVGNRLVRALDDHRYKVTPFDGPRC